MARRNGIDSKTVIIFILLILVIAEGFFLFVRRSEKKAPVKKVVVVVKEKKPPAVTKEEDFIVIPAAETPAKPVVGHIAVIVDDCGYSVAPCSTSAALTEPVTFSVLPNLKHSVDVAECVHKNGKEVMLHLPMEPHHNTDKYPEGYIILTTMDKNTIEGIIAKSLQSVPFAAGVNNHMGSKATEDKDVMVTTLAMLKKRGLFFVDSMVTDNSVGKSIADEIQIPFTRRDVFLDNKNERSAIEKQFAQLAAIAKKRGYAIGIGHARSLTLQIIKEQTELLAKQGFKFVTVQGIINKQ